VRLGPVQFYVRVGRCVCVWRATKVCSMKCPRGPGRDARDAVASVHGHRARQGQGRGEAQRR
jgi:hypothetical protein